MAEMIIRPQLLTSPTSPPASSTFILPSHSTTLVVLFNTPCFFMYCLPQFVFIFQRCRRHFHLSQRLTVRAFVSFPLPPVRIQHSPILQFFRWLFFKQFKVWCWRERAHWRLYNHRGPSIIHLTAFDHSGITFCSSQPSGFGDISCRDSWLSADATEANGTSWTDPQWHNIHTMVCIYFFLSTVFICFNDVFKVQCLLTVQLQFCFFWCSYP